VLKSVVVGYIAVFVSVLAGITSRQEEVLDSKLIMCGLWIETEMFYSVVELVAGICHRPVPGESEVIFLILTSLTCWGPTDYAVSYFVSCTYITGPTTMLSGPFILLA